MAQPSGAPYLLTELFSQVRPVRVPYFQRDYDWKGSQLDKLMEDLHRHSKDVGNPANDPYFMGNLIMWKDDYHWDVVDGQQRLTGITILSCALRDHLYDIGKYDLAESLHNLVISKDDGTPRFSSREGSRLENQLRYYQKKSERTLILISENEVDNEGEMLFNHETITYPFTVGIGFEFTTVEGHKLTSRTVREVNSDASSLFGQIEFPEGLENLPAGSALQFIQDERQLFQDEVDGLDFRAKLTKHYNRSKKWVSALDSEDHPNLYRTLINLAFTATVFDNEEDAIYYFEMMNDDQNRLSLSSGDLFRAKIASICLDETIPQEHKKVIKQKWSSVEKALRLDGKFDYISDFLWTWLLSRGKRVSKKRTWSAIKTILNSGVANVRSMLNILARAAPIYREIHKPAKDDSMSAVFQMLDFTKQHKPLALNIYYATKDFTADEDEFIEDVWRYARIYARFNLLGSILQDAANKIPSNKVYTMVEEICKKFWCWPDNANEEQIQNILLLTNAPEAAPDILFAELKKRIDGYTLAGTDEQIPGLLTDLSFGSVDEPHSNFTESDFSQQEAKLILTVVEWYMRGFEEEPSWMNSTTHIEHILPTNPKKTETAEGEFVSFTDWPQFTTEELHAEMRNKLGNRCIMPAGANQSLGNISFEQKKVKPSDGYNARKGSWKLVNFVSQYEDWTEDTINQYGHLVAQIAVHVFGHDTFCEENLAIEPITDETIDFTIPENLTLEEE